MPTEIDHAFSTRNDRERRATECPDQMRRRNGPARIVLRFALIFLAALAGCSTLPNRTPDNSGPPAATRTFYVVTTRTLPANQDNRGQPGRTQEPTFAEYAFSVPSRMLRGNDGTKETKPGQARILDARTFWSRLTAHQSEKPPRIGVFVHGYNTTFEESLEHVAAMAASADGAVTPVLFAWPSAGRSTAYIADRDAAAFSRDALARLLAGLAADRRLGEVTVFGHSMGAWLAVEALRQLKIEGAVDNFDRLHVILAAPDIDIDLFRVQIEKIGAMPNPMIVLVSPDDRVLRLSARLAGDRRRVGSLGVDDPRVAAGARKAGLIVVDISDAHASNTLNHDKYVELAKRYRRLARTGEGGSILHRAGAYIFDPETPNLLPME